MPTAVELRGITKRFPGVVANDHVDFEAAEGEVHALLGENGAGKSTLSNILTGLYRADEGEMHLHGQQVAFASPRDALDAGVCMVHQHFRLVAPFTVAENVVLGDHRGEGKKLIVNPRRIERRVAELGKRYRIAVDPRARIWQLSLGEPVLEVRGLSALGDRGGDALREVTLTVGAGEIVAIAGVAGNGQRELAETVTGMRSASAGSVVVAGKALHGGDAREAIRAHVAHVPEDRLHTGVAPSLSIASNVVLKSYRGRTVVKGPLLRLRTIRDYAAQLIKRYDVRGGGPELPARRLSGGNLQKVVLAREFEGKPRVLVVASPTRGLDVGSIETVHGYLRDAASDGVGVLLISEDLDEILALADRIAVIYEGAIAGERPVATATVGELGLLMAGGHIE